MSDTASWAFSDLLTAPVREQLLFLVILALYLVATEVARRQVIRPQYQKYLLSRQRGLRANLSVLVERDGRENAEEKAVKTGVLSLLDRSVELLEEKTRIWKPWSGACEIGACRLIHEAEALVIDLLPHPALLGRLQGMAVEVAGKPPLAGLTKRIGDHFKTKAERDDVDASRELLREGILLSNSMELSTFQRFIALLSKIRLLTSLGLLLILPLGLVFGNLHLFLFGAVGGFLVPTVRIVRSQDLPTGYDSYWPTLLLIPLLGALTGWVGVLVIDVLSNGGHSLLGGLFEGVKWKAPLTDLRPLFAALAMGFASERLEALMGGGRTKNQEPAKKPG